MRQRKSKRVLIYLFLLLLVGSINNIGLNKINFSKISKIKVLGLGDEKNDSLLETIYDLNLGNILFINGNEIKNIIDINSLVEKYDVFKIYPSDLYVNIQKNYDHDLLIHNHRKNLYEKFEMQSTRNKRNVMYLYTKNDVNLI